MLLWLLAVVAPGCAPDSAPSDDLSPTPDPWHWIDADGRAVIHRGVNLNNSAKDAGYDHGLTPEEVALLPANGITLVRFLVFWEAIEPTDGAFDELSRVFDNIARRLPIPPHFRRLVFALARWTVGSDPERVRPILVAPELSMPALFIHGERDPLVPPDAALNLANATGNNGRYMLYDGYHDESDNPAMHALVCDFFDEVDPVAPVTTSAAD